MHERERDGLKRGKTVSRREFMKAAALGVAAGAVGAEEAQASPVGQGAAAQTQEEAITASDVAVSDKVAGRSHTPAEREQMARRLGAVRSSLKAARQAELPSGAELAVRFDPNLPGMEIPVGRSSFRISREPARPYSGNPESLAFATAVELSRLLQTRRITSMELTRMYLDRLKRFGPRLNCVVTLTEELALRQAERADREMAAGKPRSLLHGIPYGVKDLFATRGIPTTYGAQPFRDQVFESDSTVVARLEAAGAVLLAKLSMGELAMGDVWFGGMTRNPWRPATGSSGSSAGSGSATAAGLVGFAIGTETLGSIVSPSVVNGVTGLRPTFGRISRYGAMTLCWTMDKVGPMCRGVEDCALVLHALIGPDGRDGTVTAAPFRWDPDSSLKGLRVGIDHAAFESAGRNEELKPVYAEALAVLKGMGIQLRPVTLPSLPVYQGLAGTIIQVESSAAFARLRESGRLSELAQQADGSWPNSFRVGSTIPAVDYLRAMQLRRQLQQEMAAALKEVDCYVTVPRTGPTIFYTNLTGHPTLVTRCGMANGLPVMIEFVGSLYREDAILRLGWAFERKTAWHRQWPDTERIPPLTG